jgi:RimJ/RimL family protein N-acetyltransferase
MPTILSEGYPPQYESRLTLKDGREVFLRPILWTDGHFLVELFNKISPDSLYFRFLRRIHSLPEDMIHRFTHVNYDSEFALVAVIEEDGKDAVIAVVRYGYNPDDGHTDFGIAIRDDWQHLGLGKSLMGRIIDIGRDHGIRSFWSIIDAQNNVMRRLLSGLGHEVKYSPQCGFLQVEILV